MKSLLVLKLQKISSELNNLFWLSLSDFKAVEVNFFHFSCFKFSIFLRSAVGIQMKVYLLTTIFKKIIQHMKFCIQENLELEGVLQKTVVFKSGRINLEIF